MVEVDLLTVGTIGGLSLFAYFVAREYWLNGKVPIVYEGGLSKRTVTRREIRDSGYTIDELEGFDFLPI